MFLDCLFSFSPLKLWSKYIQMWIVHQSMSVKKEHHFILVVTNMKEISLKKNGIPNRRKTKFQPTTSMSFVSTNNSKFLTLRKKCDKLNCLESLKTNRLKHSVFVKQFTAFASFQESMKFTSLCKYIIHSYLYMFSKIM